MALTGSSVASDSDGPCRVRIGWLVLGDMILRTSTAMVSRR